jgi:lipopolysaccharide/colanic/teichoic acid biosynthesis glycosyltransferase
MLSPHPLAFASVGFSPVAPKPSRRVARPLQVVDAELFKMAIAREQKRVDRSDKAFAVLTVELTDGRADELMNEAADALAAATRAGDVIGWLRPGEALGVLMSDMSELNFAQTSAVETRVGRQLAALLGVPGFRLLSVRLHVHSSKRRTQQPAWVPQPRFRLHDTLKRLLDLGGSAALMIMLSPLFLLIAAAIKLSSKGPVLFRQERVGQGMAQFTMLKFRTMRPDVGDAVHQAYVAQFIKGRAASPNVSGVFKLTNDPRITPIGRILRKTSLDELPQLWNVFRGDMSLVGPRPALQYEVEHYQSWHRRRLLDAKPGITGLWQVKGRSRTTFDDMVRLDLRYARTSSFTMDLKILLETVSAVNTGRGAC